MTQTKLGRFSFALVGSGRVGTATATLLTRAGHKPVAVASRDPDSAARAAERLGATAVSFDALPEVEVVLVGGSDAAIPVLCRRIAARLAEEAVVWHFAGSLGLGAFESVAGRARLAAIHPVQSCPDVDSAIRRLPGSAWGVTTSPGLEGWAESVVEVDLKGSAVAVPDMLRPVWHAASVTTANGLSALLAASEAILSAIGVERPEQVLAPLALGALSNAREQGGGGATLTGPVVRGEAETVARHLASLARLDPSLARSYIAIARVIIDGAKRSDRLDPGVEDQMLRILEDL